jgi:hypothetical protein
MEIMCPTGARLRLAPDSRAQRSRHYVGFAARPTFFEISIAFGSGETGIAVQVPPDEKIPKLARPAGPFALRHALQPAGRGTGPLITPWFSW